MFIKAMTRKNRAGFSLVELLVVVGIIGTLAAVGVPRYQKYMARAKVSTAVSLASSVNTMQEAWKTNPDNVTYASSMAVLDANSDLKPMSSVVWGSNTKGVLSGTSATAWTWTATATAGALGSCEPGAHAVTINQNGVMTGEKGPTTCQ